jgi:hypothetical protein
VHLAAALLAGGQLADLELGTAQIASAQLHGAVLADSELGTAQLASAQLDGTLLADSELGTAQLVSAQLDGEVLADSELGTAQLTSAQLGGAVLADSELGTDLAGKALEPNLAVCDNNQSVKACAGLVHIPSMTPEEIQVWRMQGFSFTKQWCWAYKATTGHGLKQLPTRVHLFSEDCCRRGCAEVHDSAGRAQLQRQMWRPGGAVCVSFLSQARPQLERR